MKSLWSKNSTEKVVPEILVEIKGVQQKTNSVDFGLFAIACATSLAFGKDPANVTYDSLKLPMHLVKCLYKNRWLASQKHRKVCLKMSVQVSFYNVSVSVACHTTKVAWSTKIEWWNGLSV